MNQASVALRLAAAIAVSASLAPADEEVSPDQRALATALFKEARRLLDDGHVAEACRKFEESERLDPGGGTLLNLAACYEREGRTASAWTEFEEALAQARRDGRADRAEIALARMAVLEPHLARVDIVVGGTANRDDLSITLDGTPVRRAAWGVALPVDPGKHSIEASAPLTSPWRTTLEVRGDSETHRVEIPVLEPEVTRAFPAPKVAPSGPSPASVGQTAPLAASKPLSAEPTGLVWRDTAMVSALAVGFSGAVLGTYFGVRAIQINDAASDGCIAGRCSAAAATESLHATTCADVSTASFLVGAAGLAAGAALFFTRHQSPGVIISADAHGAFIVTRAQF